MPLRIQLLNGCLIGIIKMAARHLLTGKGQQTGGLLGRSLWAGLSAYTSAGIRLKGRYPLPSLMQPLSKCHCERSVAIST
jgi:hypothetical protein